MKPAGKTVFGKSLINPHWFATFMPHFMFKYQHHPETSSSISSEESLSVTKAGHGVSLS